MMEHKSPRAFQGSVALPERRRERVVKRLRSISPLFAATVVIPTILATAYFGFLASDVYISEARFVVRSADKGGVSPLGAVLGGGSLSGPSEETNAVVEYINSRRALQETNRDQLVLEAYGPAHASWIDRFGSWRGASTEDLYDYFQDKVIIDGETTTNVTRLTVHAFTPADAHAINTRLLEQSEALVNRLSERAREDSIRIARGEVEEAQQMVRAASAALASYRKQSRIIDPEAEAGVRLQMISKLQDELIAARTQLLQLQVNAPEASQIAFLRTRIGALEREIAEQTQGVAGGTRSLSAAAERFQELQLENEIAVGQLEAALGSLREAQAEARRKVAYIERISSPSLPDDAEAPSRIRGILATFVLGLIAWGVLSTLIVGIREHKD